METLDKWIALAEVRPRPGVTILDSDRVGAFVTLIALANSVRASCRLH